MCTFLKGVRQISKMLKINETSDPDYFELDEYNEKTVTWLKGKLTEFSKGAVVCLALSV